MPDPWYQATVRLAATVAAQVVAIQNVEAMPQEQRIALQAAAIAKAQRQATAMNDVLLAAQLTHLLGREVKPIGLAWHETADVQTERLSKAAATVISDTSAVAYIAAAPSAAQTALMVVSIAERLSRLADYETTAASQWAQGEGMQRREGVEIGWFRNLSPNACKFCVKLAGSPPSAHVHQPHWQFAKHPGCKCSRQIVADELGAGQYYVNKRGKGKGSSLTKSLGEVIR